MKGGLGHSAQVFGHPLHVHGETDANLMASVYQAVVALGPWGVYQMLTPS